MIDAPTVLEAKRFEIYAAQADTTLCEACRKISSEDISSLVITDAEGYLAGILTRADLIHARLKYPDWLEHPVSEWMSKEVITVTPETTLIEVAQALITHHIHRVVIVRNENGRLRPLGVISDSDLVYHMSCERKK